MTHAQSFVGASVDSQKETLLFSLHHSELCIIMLLASVGERRLHAVCSSGLSART